MGNIVLIGNCKSGKTSLLKQLVNNNEDEDDGKYETTENNKIYDTVFMDKDDEKENNINCSFIDTSGDLKNISSTICGISSSDIAIILISMEQNRFDSSLEELKEFARILNTYGVERCICCLSNIDSINYDQDQYNKAQIKTEKMIK